MTIMKGFTKMDSHSYMKREHDNIIKIRVSSDKQVSRLSHVTCQIIHVTHGQVDSTRFMFTDYPEATPEFLSPTMKEHIRRYIQFFAPHSAPYGGGFTNQNTF